MAIHLYGRPGRTKDALKKVGYRLYRPELGSPDSQGFYHGYPCHLGHTLRDKKSHWCHDCAFRINSHVVGLDISFLDDLYSDRAVAVINMLKELTGGHFDPAECWDIGSEAAARFCYPSYRAHKSKRKIDQVLIKKIVYQLFWGDIGKLYVTRDLNVCQNPNCVNPLHLASTFNQNNRRNTPSFHYLDLTPCPKKLMLMRSRQTANLSIDDVLARVYRPTIRDPKIDKQ